MGVKVVVMFTSGECSSGVIPHGWHSSSTGQSQRFLGNKTLRVLETRKVWCVSYGVAVGVGRSAGGWTGSGVGWNSGAASTDGATVVGKGSR